MSATSLQVESEAPLAGQRSILPNAWHLTLSQVIRRSFRMAVLFWTARLLGVATFGEYALLLTVVEMAAVISGSGYISYLTREIASDAEAAWPLGAKVTQVRFALIMPVIAAEFLILWLLRFPAVVTANAVYLSLSLFPRAINEAIQGVLGGLWRFAPLCWIETAQGCILVTVAPLLVLKGYGLRGVLTAEILAATGGAICAAVSVVGLLDFRNHRTYSLGRVLRSLYAFNIFPFITNVYDRVDIVLLARLAGDFATGIYSLPYRVLASLQILPYGLMGALLPGMSASGVSTPQARANLARILQILYSVALIMILTTFAFAPAGVGFILGPKYAGSALAMKILIWAAVPMFVNHALNILLLAAHHERVFLRTSAICTLFNISANLLFIPRYSFVAAAVITILTELVLLGMNCYLVQKRLGGIELPRQFRAITLSFVIALFVFRVIALRSESIWVGVPSCVAFAGFAIWMARDAFRLLVEKVGSLG